MTKSPVEVNAAVTQQ